MKIIVSINNLNYIGKDNKMLWYSKDDLEHFKKLTMGCKLLVGRKTYENLPKLKGRELIIVGGGHNTLEDGLSKKPDWVIGGALIYLQTAHLCDEMHISHIDNNLMGDTLFPNIDFKGKTFNYYFK